MAATCDCVTLGTKIIPSYHTSEGIKAVPVGSSFSLKIFNYDYTKLQALICVYNTSLSDSVATDKVCINENVYEVNKIDVLSIISKNHNNGTIEFGIKNTSDKPYLIRYFTYKEIY